MGKRSVETLTVSAEAYRNIPHNADHQRSNLAYDKTGLLFVVNNKLVDDWWSRQDRDRTKRWQDISGDLSKASVATLYKDVDSDVSRGCCTTCLLMLKNKMQSQKSSPSKSWWLTGKLTLGKVGTVSRRRKSALLNTGTARIEASSNFRNKSEIWHILQSLRRLHMMCCMYERVGNRTGQAIRGQLRKQGQKRKRGTHAMHWVWASK